MKNNNIFAGALILSIGGVLAKIFSAVYRITLTRILGGQGIGLYQLVFPLYSLCVVLATAGLPMAISKVISRNKNCQASIVKKCVVSTSVFGLIIAFLLIVCSKPLAMFQGAGEIWVCYLILAPTIILISATSVLRGYFQGVGYFTPPTISSILEQFAKLFIGLILCLSLVQISIYAAIIGAIVAIAASELVALFVLLMFLKHHRPLDTNLAQTVSFKQILKDVLPITLTNVILPISGFVDSLLVVNLLAINFSKNLSIFMYGIESGAVSSIIGLPTIFSFAIASVLLPSLAGREHIFNKTYKLALALKTVLIITLPCVICFLLFPDRLMIALYSSKLSAYGVSGLNMAFRLLAISGIGVVFLAINQLYSSCLQAIDRRVATIRNLSVAVLVKLLIELIFLPSVTINIYALAIGNTACYLTTMLLNHFEIKLCFPLKFDYAFMCKLLLCNAVMLVVLIFAMGLSDSVCCTLLGFAFAAVVYLFTLFAFKIFSNKDKAILRYKAFVMNKK